MQLGLWKEVTIVQGEDALIKYESTKDIFRCSCAKCGSFCLKSFITYGTPDNAIPLGALTGDPVIQPDCHIFVNYREGRDIMFPELTQYSEYPDPKYKLPGTGQQ